MKEITSLTGKVLIAMPGIRDSIFEHSLVFMCAHSDQGAMGIVINKPAPLMFFSDLLDKVELADLEKPVPEEVLALRVMIGGPVEQFRGFVLHSCDYEHEHHTLKVGDGYRLTATVDVLRQIASGEGPENRVIALGYSGWAPGQLEDEMQHNGWLFCEPSDALLFGDDIDHKHGTALKAIGVDPSKLSGDYGHA